jgi:hypothetical protein
MNIDLAALPDDVETLRRMVRSLAAERTALSEAQGAGGDREAAGDRAEAAAQPVRPAG